jgi:hypothetical protein
MFGVAKEANEVLQWEKYPTSIATNVANEERQDKSARAHILLGVQEVPGSNPGGPTKFFKELQIVDTPEVAFWSPTGVQNGRRGGGPPVQSVLKFSTSTFSA